MHRQHPALAAVQTVRGSALGTSQRLSTSRSLLASAAGAGLPMLGLLLACSGCYGPYQSPYGGYGSPYGYPPAGAPTQTLQPGGTYTPSPYGQPASPYNSFPQPTPSQPSTIDQTGGSGPFYNSGSGGSTSQPYDGGGVPTYNDPNEVQFQEPIQPDNTAIDSYGAVEQASAAMAGVAKVDLDTANFVVDESNFTASQTPGTAPATVTADAAAPSTAAQNAAPVPAAASEFQGLAQFEAAQAEIEVAQTGTAPAGEFEFPQTELASDVEAAPAPMPFPGEAVPLTSATTPVPAAPFAHDAEFTWLRGVLRFDAASGTWMMIYSDNPSSEDEHGGKLLVADSPLLEQFKPQAVVLLRGGIDEGQSATAGRAVFRADVIEPVDLSVP